MVTDVSYSLVVLQARYSNSGQRYGGHKLYLEIVGPGGEATIVCRNLFVGRKGRS
jgi:hypothetical protein